MSEGYWKGQVTTGREHFAAPDEATAPSAPAVAETVGAGAYWQGTYQPPEQQPAEDAVHRDGSVSSRARRAYAAEALRQKDHVAAGLLAIFLGVFGVHKFYLGCNQTGFLMLAVSIIGGIVTFGVAALVIEVIALIEGVIYLTKSQTEFDRIYVLNQRDWF